MDRPAAPQQQLSAIRSSIAWALLGLVIERPSYGYELSQRFRRIYGETLALSSPTRIYTALESLRVRSLIEEIAGEAEAKPSRQPRPRYRATPDGVRAYQEWLYTQIEEQRQRQRLFVRQLAMLEPETALYVIDEYERGWLDDADEASALEPHREDVAERLAEEDEHLALEARLSWIRYARRELAALIEERDGGAKS